MVRSVIIALAAFLCWPAEAQERKTENVVIITLDGFRWREVFHGADEKMLRKHKFINDTSVVTEFDAPDYRERREKLLPFFWDVIAKEGQLYGNRDYGNKVQVTNRNVYSYSGYSEMFVGYADRRIKNNDEKLNPNTNILEELNKNPKFRGKIAAFSTWKLMPLILREEPSGIFVNSGTEKVQGDNLTDHEEILNRITDDIKNPYGERYDNFTFQYAMEYLKRKKPRVMFISLDETDEHGHGERYDEYLKSAHRADEMISGLWNWLQSQEQYRDKTTLMITTDHGRGRSPKGWIRHAILFRGSAQIFLAVIGPDTPAGGEMQTRMKLTQNQVAKTIAELLQFDYSNPLAKGEVITSVFKDHGEEQGSQTVSGAGN